MTEWFTQLSQHQTMLLQAAPSALTGMYENYYILKEIQNFKKSPC